MSEVARAVPFWLYQLGPGAVPFWLYQLGLAVAFWLYQLGPGNIMDSTLLLRGKINWIDISSSHNLKICTNGESYSRGEKNLILAYIFTELQCKHILIRVINNLLPI